jgi:TolA-binding protein
MFRLAETRRALSENDEARQTYLSLVKNNPLSPHASRSRLMAALCVKGEERKRELTGLIDSSAGTDVKSAALYHLGIESSDTNLLQKCIAVDPKGRYAPYAKYALASELSKSPVKSVRRQAMMVLLELHYAGGELAEDALYLLAGRSYAAESYNEASILFRKFLNKYPKSQRFAQARIMAAWSDFSAGKYADAASLAAGLETEEAAYLLASAAYASGDLKGAALKMREYLDKYPTGKYRSSIELPLARMEYDNAEKENNVSKLLESAKRAVSLSDSASDRLRLAWAYGKAENEKMQFAEYEAVASKFPKTPEAVEALFRCAMREVEKKNWARADFLLAEALQQGGKPREVEILYWRGVSSSMLSHGEESVQFFKKALKMGLSVDRSREAKIFIADNDYNAGRIAEAKKQYAMLVREGACTRMSASKIRSVGMLLLQPGNGEPAFEEAKMCGEELIKAADVQWKQSGYAILGMAHEALGDLMAAAEAYRKGLQFEKRNEDARIMTLNLGVLDMKAGNRKDAEKYLKEAVGLNGSDSDRRAKAYLYLAKNCEAMTDFRGANAYATVVVTLFDNKEFAEEAKKILQRCGENVK